VNAEINGLCDQGPTCLLTSSTRCQNQTAPVFKDDKNTQFYAMIGMKLKSSTGSEKYFQESKKN